MSILEIPIEAEENKEILEEKEEREENLEKDAVENNIPQGSDKVQTKKTEPQKNEENEEDDEPPQKRPRGRPKGTAKPKEEKPQKPQKPPKEPKEPKKKEVVKPKIPKKRAVKFQSSSEEELPEYVRREVGPAVERDLSMQMLRLLQNHESIKASNRRRLYASWFAHH